MTAARFILPADRPRDEILARMVRFVHQLDAAKAWEWTCAPYKRKRSVSQNNALFGVAYPPIMEHCGLRGERDREDLHSYFCGEFWGWVEYDLLGKRKHRPKRTTTTNEDGKRDVISTTEFMDFYAFVQQRAAEQGILVPDPDPEWFMKDKKAA
jgi:hypothetical protein